MLRSRLWGISKTWRPHSEQLKQWIASSANDVNKLNVARTYAKDLSWPNCVADADDCLEAVTLLHRIGFSKESRVFEALKCESFDFTAGTLRSMIRSFESDSGLFDCVVSVFLVSSDDLQAFKGAFHALSPEDQMKFSSVFWRHSCSASGHQKPDCWGVNAAISSSLAETLFQESKPHMATLMQLAEACFPDCDSNTQVLTDRIIQANGKLSPDEQLKLMGTLVVAPTFNCCTSPWFLSLRKCFSSGNGESPLTADQILSFSALLTEMQFIPTSEEMSQICGALLLCDMAKVLTFSESLTHLSGERELHWRPCINSVTRRALDVLKAVSSTVEEQTIGALCLSYVEPSIGRMEVDRIIEHLDLPKAPPAVVGRMLRCFAMLDVYPYEILSALDLQKLIVCFTREDCVFLLYTLVRTDHPIPRSLVKKSCGRSFGRQFVKRANAGISEEADLTPTGFVFFLASLGCLNEKDHDVNGESVAIAILEQKGVVPGSMEMFLETMSKVPAPSELRKTAVTMGIRSVHAASPTALLRTVLKSMSVSHVRDAAGYEKILACLKLSATPLDVETVLCAASAGQVLHLTPQFERSGLVESLRSFADWPEANLIELARMCTASQRQRLMGVSEVKARLTKHHHKIESESDRILLFNMLPDENKREVLKRAQHGKNPAVSENVSAEDAVTALENVLRLDPKDFEVVFRTVSQVLADVNEQQLMRVLWCLSQLPSCPNYAFRTLGKAVLRLSEAMSAINAVHWLSFYTKNRIRDDSVGKALIRKASAKNATLSREASEQLLCGARFYGQMIKNPHGAKKKKQMAKRRYLPSAA